MSPILEGNTGSSNTLPGPVKTITCQAGQVVVVDKTTEPPTTTTLNPDDVYDAEGKAGLTILDIDGSRIFYESTLENRTSGQMVDTPGSAAQLGTDIHGDPIDTPVTPALNGEDSDAFVPTENVPGEQRGDTDGDSPTGGTGAFEDRTVKELRATAKKNGVDLKGAKTKAKIIAALRA